ncbi:PREDICTED: stimulator of interferon genes protein isoform X2 [Vollenhovia emeryi]|uniref:stimulator of interferon genes protein isoform X2 n=1 Tax=Vollenhovia emeryi TaxID=411798 RepID=UPI0005F52E28|nr:PREDICTED: stimulator of interferon genes protein isoform X2 [Vollenhovia emeryi]
MESEVYSSAERKMRIYLAYGVVLAVVYAFAVYRATKDRAMASVVATILVASVFLVVFLICDLALRLCQTIVTYATEPGESFWSVARYHFALNTASATIVAVGALLFLGLTATLRRCPLSYAWDFGPYVCVPLLIFSYCLLRTCNLAEWEVGSLADLGDLKGLDCGTGMAYSFYYGYLRLMLPTSDDTSKKGIVEKIENFEDTHNIRFPVHKLFILIPSSGYIPPDLKEASFQWMENVRELEEEKRNRAGNIGRTYRNHVYKIYPGGRNSSEDPVYVVAEGASPLLTYYESQPETRDLCELIYYDDYDAKGNKVNVATIILERISEIENSA